METRTFDQNVLEDCAERHQRGESWATIAAGLGVSWQLVHSAVSKRLGSAGDAELIAPSGRDAMLTEKYRPWALKSIFGQERVVEILRNVAKAQAPMALLFEGETGTGKTSAAVALAHELGCHIEQQEMGGLHVIAAGEQSADSVRETYSHMWHMPFFGSGWKVLVVNEADRMSGTVETVWLDRLESLPPRTMVVFTTNHPEKLSQRLRDRMMILHFDSDHGKLKAPACDLLAAMWKSEGGAPDHTRIDQIVSQASVDGQLSFRRAVQLLQSALMAQKK